MTWHQITFFTESVLRHTKSLQVKTVIKSPCKVSLSAQKCHHGTNGWWGKCRAVPGCRCIYNRGLTLRLKEHLHIAGQFFFFPPSSATGLPLSLRCSRVRSPGNSPGDRCHTASHRLPRPLLPHCLPAQLHRSRGVMWQQRLHHTGHMYGEGPVRYHVSQVRRVPRAIFGAEL